MAGGLRSAKDIEGVLERDLKPAFTDVSVDELTRENVSSVLESIGARSHDAANKAFKWLRQLCNWLVDKGVLAASPVARMKMPYSEGRRTRTPPLVELVVVWVAIDVLPEPFRSFYRLMILLGQRLREVANLPWSEIDMEAGDWLVPASRTKNKRNHLVPLPDQAVAILTALQPEAVRRRGPAITTDGRVGISGFSKLKERVDALVAELLASSEVARALVGEGVAQWVVHDLRRSLATGCEAMGIPLTVTEAVLNHASGSRSGIAGVYHVHEFYDEKAEALQRWADLIDAAVVRFRMGDVEGVRELDPTRRRLRRRRASKNDG